ncbi:hypothetical protein DCAR_0310498 [Daucus carota subsp. sativus]|uniref:Uncharacterized protein n=1 Tax=Daucus carota subsp. sativus TaxID=79200 RepID=A0A165ZXA1_DAUCS|nr:PREDICTED: uncharacterized protein LOC108213434 [Daucus carota subsp. sativus]WOG91250.1 hypothetical protein DCAR_0310498 [Daucus carota subsp. sativus]
MKGVGSKAISSPSRGENYPAPLIMRFLKSNAGSRSRGGGARPRSSPMFVVRKKNVAATIETQEPSSPKVTCIGQVRVRHSKKFNSTKRGQLKQSQGTCTCFSVAKCSFRNSAINLKKWASFFRFGFRKNVDSRDNSAKSELDHRGHINDAETEMTGNEGNEAQLEEKEDTEEVSRGAKPPPRNALLLTRSRSAPFRSSSLAVQLWGETNNDIADVVRMRRCFREFDHREKESEKQMSRKLGIDEEGSEEICAMGKLAEGDSSIGKSMERLGMPHPLLLTRCRSESALKTRKGQA